jgi:hypothetical protein
VNVIDEQTLIDSAREAGFEAGKKAFADAVDKILEAYTKRKWGGDGTLERLLNALYDIHTETLCGECGRSVRARCAITTDNLCHTCAADRIKSLEEAISLLSPGC